MAERMNNAHSLYRVIQELAGRCGTGGRPHPFYDVSVPNASGSTDGLAPSALAQAQAPANSAACEE